MWANARKTAEGVASRALDHQAGEGEPGHVGDAALAGRPRPPESSRGMMRFIGFPNRSNASPPLRASGGSHRLSDSTVLDTKFHDNSVNSKGGRLVAKSRPG